MFAPSTLSDAAMCAELQTPNSTNTSCSESASMSAPARVENTTAATPAKQQQMIAQSRAFWRKTSSTLTGSA